MASKIRVVIIFLFLFVVAFAPGASLCAQSNTELVSRPDTAKSVKLNQVAPLRISNIRRPVDRVVEEPAKPSTAQPDTTPRFVPDPNVDPRHKLDSATAATPADTSKSSLIYLERTDLMLFDSDNLPDIQVLTGDVVLRHDEAYLYCDSAHLNQVSNSFEAFGRVHIDQGDSVNIYSRHLRYNGNTRVANLYHNVRLVNGEVTILTDTLTYDRNRKMGYYLCGGTVQDSVNTLVSDKGYYYSDTKVAEFKSNVFGYNDDNNIVSDTLRYNTDTKVATILGPTTITHLEDSSTIYSELGWYDTERDLSQLLSKSLITYSEGRTLQGDTIFYDKKKGAGEAFSNVVITDMENSIILTGHYGYYLEQDDQSLLTDSALMREFSEADTVYAHADTLYAYQLADSSKVVHLYHNGRLYHPDFQAIADSMCYTSADSIIHLRQMPVLWNEGWQITGDSIDIFPTDGSLNRAHVVENAMIVQEEDTIHYNQMSGREFMAYIGDEVLDSLHIMGNAESVFFPTDDGKMIGLNKIQSSYMTIYFADGKLDRLKVFPQPKANMYPMEQIKEEMLRLPNFTWQIAARPASPDDIFRKPKRITSAQLQEQKDALIQQQKDERRRKRNAEIAAEDNPTQTTTATQTTTTQTTTTTSTGTATRDIRR